MDIAAAALVIRALIVAGIVLSLFALQAWRARRRRDYAPALPQLPAELRGGAPLTAYYFTSRLCAACQETPGIVREAASDVPIVALWVHERPDLVRALGVFETPTLLLADAQGRIRYARVGNPGVEELRTYIWEALDSSGPGPSDALAPLARSRPIE